MGKNMLFNLDMIAFFLSDYDITVFASGDPWQIRSMQVGQPPANDDPALLYVYPEDDTVWCVNAGSHILVRNAALGDVLNSLMNRIMFYNDWERRALNATAGSHSLSEYLPLMQELFPGFTIKLLDALGRIHYSTDPAEQLPKPMDPLVINLVRNIPACHKISLGLPGITLFWSRHFARHYLFGNFVFPDGSFVIFSVFPEDPNGPQLSSMHLHLGQLAQGVFQRANIASIDDGSLMANRNSVMHILDGATVNDSDLRDLETALGWKVADGAYVIKIENTTNDGFAARALPYTISREIPSAFTFNYDEGIICLLPRAASERSFQKLEEALAPIGFRCGVSLPFTSWAGLPTAFQQARTTVSLRGKGPSPLMRCRDYLWDYYLQVLQTGGGEKMAHPDIQALIENSPPGEPILLETFYTYLRCNCSMVNTAASLNLHINTLKYRLGKIRSIVSFDPEDYESRMTFLVSCDMLHACRK